MTTVSIVGGSGYGGGEALRLLLNHPNVEVKQVTSRSHMGEFVYQVHPNLRKRTQLKFSDPSQLEPVDVLFLAQPHGEAQHHIDQHAKLATKIVDLAADFRLRDAAVYEKWYGEKHVAPQWLSKFVYGLPELHRAELAAARDATIIAPLTHLGLIECVGDDATDFLHNQLTSDVNHLAANAAQHSSWCTAKGRMQASFVLYRVETGFRALLAADLMAAQRLVRRAPIGESVVESILDLVRAARPGEGDPELVKPIAWGPGPRAAQALMLACRARALVDGRFAPSRDDIAALAEPGLKHRMALSYAARADGETIPAVVARLVAKTLG